MIYLMCTGGAMVNVCVGEVRVHDLNVLNERNGGRTDGRIRASH